MDWRDEGILLSVRRHGESSAIIETLTATHGRCAGLVRGGASKKQAALLQPGAQLSLEWSARLAEHLGTYRVDLVRGRAAAIMARRETLAALNAVNALLTQFLPEREPNARIYMATISVIDALADANPFWPMLYAHWELALLDVLGFGLDLDTCAATGQSDDLAYVSPRSGRAVSRAAGAPYATKMLPLPGFLIQRARPAMAEIRDALRTTGYFLENRVRPAFEVADLPTPRTRLMDLLAGLEIDADNGADLPPAP